MSRLPVTLALLLVGASFLFGFGNDGPPISITSPDTGTTYARADIKSHSLIWYKKSQTLAACVTFTDARMNDGTPHDDIHYFTFPGITFDEAKGIFTAKAINGEAIPVAHIKKTLFLKTIEVTPNATVRIQYPHGDITVKLEAISPNDPAMHAPPPKPANSNSDGTHDVNFKDLLN